jgi:hypothetical protein
MKKINSEIKIDNPNLKIKWGTTDKKNPLIFYLEIGSYITPRIEQESYKKNISAISKNASNLIKSAALKTNIASDNIIFVSDIADERIEYGKKSFLTFQIHFKNKDIKKYNKFNDIVNQINGSFSDVYDGAKSIIEENGFECFKTK